MKNTVLTILGIVFVAGMGVGGYFLGRYLDQSAVDKAYQAELAKPITQVTYKNTDLGIQFEYPSNWTLTVPVVANTDLEENIKTVIVYNGSGSRFIYNKSDVFADIVSENIKRCDSDDPQGKIAGNTECTFVNSDNQDYARFRNKDLDTSDFGEYWGIALPGDAANTKVMMYFVNKYFAYNVKNASDLTVLDTIMKSVKYITK